MLGWDAGKELSLNDILHFYNIQTDLQSCTPEEITSFNYTSIAVEQSEALESDLRDFTRR